MRVESWESGVGTTSFGPELRTVNPQPSTSFWFAQAAGLGTDYDGDIDPPTGLEDVSRLTLVTEEPLRSGHSEQVVRGVLGENIDSHLA